MACPLLVGRIITSLQRQPPQRRGERDFHGQHPGAEGYGCKSAGDQGVDLVGNEAPFRSQHQQYRFVGLCAGERLRAARMRHQTAARAGNGIEFILDKGLETPVAVYAGQRGVECLLKSEQQFLDVWKATASAREKVAQREQSLADRKLRLYKAWANYLGGR